MAELAADIGFDRVHDLRVARAATEVALERGADRLAIGPRLALEEGQRRQQHAGRAEAALHGAVAHERLLQRVQATVALQLAQRLVRAHLDLSRAPVEDEARDHVRPSARATARASARRHSTPATWRRYAPETKASDGGSSASRAVCAACARTSAVGSRPRSASSTARAHTGRSATPPKATRASS